MIFGKRNKIDELRKSVRAATPEKSEASLDDSEVLEELCRELDIAELREYMQQHRRRVLEAESKQMRGAAEAANPYRKLSTARIVALIEHKNKIVAQGAELELARRNFFYFCHLRAPKFYRADRPYIVKLCKEFQDFYESDEVVLIVNMPPRFGKSRTAGLFEQWVFGKNSTEQIMTGSYNETLSTTFSKAVRNGIQEIKGDPDKIVYSDIFPGVKIQRGDAAMNLWSLEGQHASYLATSPSGTATGFGATLLVLDDLIKSAQEAFNDEHLKNLWQWFADTMFSRLEEGGKLIIIMTRWASEDVAGRAMKYFKEEGVPVRTVTMKALINESTHEMLCPAILSYKRYLLKVRAMSEEIASANYQQIPIDLKGRLYQSFKTYDDIPRNDRGKPLFTAIKSYADTADTGKDYLCNIIYGEYLKEAYVLDIYYTKDAMEKTEPETAKRLHENDVRIADIESNNGGRGFARNVERILKDKFRSNKCKVRWFHQSQNKRARILTNSSWVQDHVYFPRDWRTRWPDYYKAMYKYQKEGKNAFDDAPDATTGVAEKIGHRGGTTIFK